MPNELDPQVDQWYAHIDKGQRFFVTAIDEDAETIEVQHFDGDLEEFSFEQWYGLDLELSTEPENWAGAMDVVNRDDLGTEVTDTSAADWNEPLAEFPAPDPERKPPRSNDTVKTYPTRRGVDLDRLLRQRDGEFRERLGPDWQAEYAEDEASGLWHAVLYKRDVVEWEEFDFASLEDAVQAAHDYYDEV